MNKKFLIGFAVITAFMLSNVTSGIAAAKPYAVGDSFTFTIDTATGSDKVNGTEYAAPVNNSIDKTSTVTVTGMNSTVVDLSYKTNSGNGTTYADVDGFTGLFFIIAIFALAFEYSTVQTADFSAPDNSSDSSLDLNYSSGYFPMFASGNTTYYKSLINTTEVSSPVTTTTTSSDYITNINKVNAQNSASGNTYTMSFDFSMTKSNTSLKYSCTIDAGFKVVIDLTRNIVTELSLSLDYQTTLDTASNALKLDMKIVEGTGSSGLPGFDFISLFAFMTIISALAIIQKKRK